jgi:hypothetical protein
MKPTKTALRDFAKTLGGLCLLCACNPTLARAAPCRPYDQNEMKHHVSSFLQFLVADNAPTIKDYYAFIGSNDELALEQKECAQQGWAERDCDDWSNRRNLQQDKTPSLFFRELRAALGTRVGKNACAITIRRGKGGYLVAARCATGLTLDFYHATDTCMAGTGLTLLSRINGTNVNRFMKWEDLERQ